MKSKKTTTNLRTGVQSVLGYVKSRPVVVFVLLSSTFGLTFSVLNPPMWGLDEPAHFARAYQIANGQIRPDTSKSNFGGSMPDNFVALSTYRNIDILDGQGKQLTGVLNRQDITNFNGYDTVLSEELSDKSVNFPVTSSYSPVSYPGPIMASWASHILDLSFGQTLFLARLLSLISYVIICSAAIWLLRKKRVAWLFVTMALLPTAVFQSATISSDTVIFSLLLLFLAIFTRLSIKPSYSSRNNVLLGLISIVAVLMPLLKVNFIFLSLLLVVLPSALFASRNIHIAYKAISVTLSTALAFIWLRMQGATNTPASTQRSDQQVVVPSEQIVHVLQNPFDFIAAFIKSIIIYGDKLFNEMFFTVSGNDIRLPSVLLVLVVGVLVLTAFHARQELVMIKRQILYLCAASLLTAVSIGGALYVGFNPVGWWYVQGMQGRYFTSLLPPLLMLIAVYVPLKHVPSSRTTKLTVITSVAVCLLVAVVYDYLAFY